MICYPWHDQKLLIQCCGMLENVKIIPFKVVAYNTEKKCMEFIESNDENH